MDARPPPFASSQVPESEILVLSVEDLGGGNTRWEFNQPVTATGDVANLQIFNSGGFTWNDPTSTTQFAPNILDLGYFPFVPAPGDDWRMHTAPTNVVQSPSLFPVPQDGNVV